MEESGVNAHLGDLSVTARIVESSGAAASSSPSGTSSSPSSSSSQVHEEAEEDRDRAPEPFPPRRTDVFDHGYDYRTNDTDVSPMIRDDAWSCVIVVLTFWFFVAMTLILGVYGSVNLQLGPNSSILLKTNSIFVESIKVEELDNKSTMPTLYGSYEDPSLNAVTTWSETHATSLPAHTHKEWIYFLNEGSQVDITYSVGSMSASSLILVIAQGNDGLSQWLEDPSRPNTTLSWNIVHGNGTIQQDISKSSIYYIAVGNLNTEEVKVELDIHLRATLYDTTNAYYRCSLTQGKCSLKLFFPGGNAAVLASPGPQKGAATKDWYVKLSYGPRWIVYLAGIGGMTLLMLILFYYFFNFRAGHDNGTWAQFGETGSERRPLLLNKDDDVLSWGSSYDSVSHDDEELEDGKPTKDGEFNNNNNTWRLCAICFDAPRDCFFLPCGHCVACFACGTRIAEAAGTCPICRRNMKKVRKIFTV